MHKTCSDLLSVVGERQPNNVIVTCPGTAVPGCAQRAYDVLWVEDHSIESEKPLRKPSGRAAHCQNTARSSCCMLWRMSCRRPRSAALPESIDPVLSELENTQGPTEGTTAVVLPPDAVAN